MATEKKKKGRSKKGSTFERWLCRYLSEWWSNNQRDDLFWRSAGSGAMAKTRSKIGRKTFGQYGDIQATDPDGQALLDVFTIEAKRGYSDQTFANMLDKPKSAGVQNWEHFYQQVRTDQMEAESISWMIITKRDSKDALISISSDITMQLSKEGADLRRVPHVRGKFRLKKGMSVKIFICSLEDFTEIIKRPHIERLKAHHEKLSESND